MYRLVHVVSLGCMLRYVTDNFFLWFHLFSFLVKFGTFLERLEEVVALVVHILHDKEILSAQPENLNEHASECKDSVDLFSKMQNFCLLFYSFLYDRNNCSINQREQIPRNPNESNDIECTSHNPQNTDQHSHPTQTAQLIPPQPPLPWNSPKPSQPAQLRTRTTQYHHNQHNHWTKLYGTTTTTHACWLWRLCWLWCDPEVVIERNTCC